MAEVDQSDDRSDAHHADLSLFDHYMTQFYHVADQRLKVFNFYLLVVLASLASSIKVLSDESVHLLAFLGVGQIFAGLSFYLLETRNKTLLNRLRATMRHLETKHFDPVRDRPLMVFNSDLLEQHGLQKADLRSFYGRLFLKNLLGKYSSFSAVFTITCTLQILLGFGAVILSIALVN